MSQEKVNQQNSKPTAFTIKAREDGVAVITIDIPDAKMNVLRADFAEELHIILDRIESDRQIKAAILVSGKSNAFIAGVDISMINGMENEEQAHAVITEGHNVLNRIAASSKPIVAAIHGLCLGGGFELTLACHARVASDDPKTKVGLPEILIGLFPGLGGCVRLPRLIGVMNSLDAILTGRHIAAYKAKKIGMVDEIVPASILHDVAAKYALKLANGFKKNTLSQRIKGLLSIAGMQKFLLEGNRFGREFLFKKTRQRTLAKTKCNYPAVERAIDVIGYGISRNMTKAIAFEEKHFCKMIFSPEAKQLMGIYFATTELKKETFVDDSGVQPRAVKKLGILGGGLMGGGIATVSIDKAGVVVRIKDIADAGLRGVYKHLHDYYQQRIKRKQLTKFDANQKKRMLSGATDYSGFKSADLVIEAVFEDLKVKHQVLKDIEALGNESTVFASNTSSLRVKDIAKAAKRPENVVGMHYFSPVEKMPLLEVIVHPKTADWVTRTAVEFGKKQGKTVIVVKDGAGFYVNRILAPYMNEAGYLALEGVSLEAIDKAIVKFGLPVGPIKLLDEVGIDIGAHMMPNIEAEFGERIKSPDFLNKLLADGRKGKKSRKGFYDYSKEGKGKTIDKSVYAVLGVSVKKVMSAEDIIDRCMLPMINEAVMCLEDNTIRSVRDGDIGSVFGIGFPPFRGGPFRYVDAIGADVIVQKLLHLETTVGIRFKPAKALVKLAAGKGKFYP